MSMTKIKKKQIKEHAKIKSFTVHLFLFSFIILVTFHTIFAYFYFALVQYIHDIDWNTLNLEITVWVGGGGGGGFAVSSDGNFFVLIKKWNDFLLYLWINVGAL